MDKTAVNNLLKKYLDCVKLLICETMPDNLPEILDDVIHDTKALSEEIKSRRLKLKSKRLIVDTKDIVWHTPSNKNHIISPVQSPKEESVVRELMPVVMLQRLLIDDHSKGIIDDHSNGIRLGFKKAKSETALKTPKKKLINPACPRSYPRPYPYSASERKTTRSLATVIVPEPQSNNPEQFNPKDQQKSRCSVQ